MEFFKTLKQSTNKTCMQTCLAMIVGESVEYVIDWLANNNALHSEDGIIFLCHHGIYPSMYAEFKKGAKLEDEDKIEFSIPLKDRPALITVKSERFKDKLHSVFWDGKKIHDPSPLVLKLRDINTYKIVEYWPLIMTQQHLDRMEE